ncbi:MAG: four helix bundle protein [Saprospirales bacterium]|nr:four helix bundle protein [Saprospirales bacterium]
MASPTGYPLFEQWYKTNDWILDKCDKLPRSTRFTLSGRIANLSLEVLELITEAIYTHERSPLLKRSTSTWKSCGSFSASAKTAA